MDVYERIHAELKTTGITLAATLPDDWVAPLIARIASDNSIRHVPVAREAEATAVCTGAFFGGVRSVAIMGATGLLTCTGDIGTLNLRHHIPVFCLVSQRGTYDDHRVYQEIQGRRLHAVLQTFNYPFVVLDTYDDLGKIPDIFEACRLHKRPYIALLTRRLVKGDKTS
jgi:sulfopyruvate decarboxylase subunit alpha